MSSTILRSALVCFLLVSFGCAEFITKEAQPKVNINANTASQYVHRGMVQVEDWVFVPDLQAQVQGLRFFPGDEGGVVKAQAKGFLNMTDENRNAWFNDGQGGKFSEVDLQLDYSRRVGPVDVGVGAERRIPSPWFCRCCNKRSIRLPASSTKGSPPS